MDSDDAVVNDTNDAVEDVAVESRWDAWVGVECRWIRSNTNMWYSVEAKRVSRRNALPHARKNPTQERICRKRKEPIRCQEGGLSLSRVSCALIVLFVCSYSTGTYWYVGTNIYWEKDPGNETTWKLEVSILVTAIRLVKY